MLVLTDEYRGDEVVATYQRVFSSGEKIRIRFVRKNGTEAVVEYDSATEEVTIIE